jgi:hypothetical protein
MTSGRLIRVVKYRGDPKSIAYIVAHPDAPSAIELIKTKASAPGDEVQDLGRVSDELLNSLNLTPGNFARADTPQKRSDL